MRSRVRLLLTPVLGGLLSAGIAGVGTYLEGGSPDQIENATGNPLNISLGLLLGAAGSSIGAYRLGRILVTAASLGFGGNAAYNAYQNGHTGAALYYTILAVGGAVLANLGQQVKSGAAAQPPSPPPMIAMSVRR